MKIKTILLGLITIISISLGESLANKVKRAQHLLKESNRLIEYGDYNQGKQLGIKAKRLIKEIEELMGVARVYNKLIHTISVAKQMGAEKWAKEDLDQAIRLAAESKEVMLERELDKERNQASNLNSWDKENSQTFQPKAMETAKNKIAEGQKHADRAIEQSKERFEVGDGDGKNRQLKVTNISGHYVVKLIPKKRDCLWRIAGYEFVYGNPWKWKLIYSANKDLIKNPDLIYPGQVFMIPPLPLENTPEGE